MLSEEQQQKIADRGYKDLEMILRLHGKSLTKCTAEEQKLWLDIYINGMQNGLAEAQKVVKKVAGIKNG